MGITLTPEALAELRELEGKATGGPAAMVQGRATIGGHGHTIWVIGNDTTNIGIAVVILPDEDDCPDARQEREATVTLIVRALHALPALLDAAEELERVKRWAKVQGNVCPTCADKLPCPDRMDRLVGSCDEWTPGWNWEVTK